VGINPILNNLKGPGTKMAEKLKKAEKFERKQNQISVLFSTQRPPEDHRH
jgi:hypothetical protein